MLAVSNQEITILIYLLNFYKDFHEDIDISGNNVLHRAAILSRPDCPDGPESTNVSMVIFKIFSKTDGFEEMLQTKNNDGTTPLFLSIQSLNYPLMQYLLKDHLLISLYPIKTNSGETMVDYLDRTIKNLS